MRVHREWLQKHPTPRAADGDFHWYPGDAPELLAEIAAGATGALTIWIAPGSVIAARRFHAVAPGDARRYAGLAVAIGAATAADTVELLARLPVPAARAWESDASAGRAEPPAAPPTGALSPSLIAAMWRGGACRGAIEGAPQVAALVEAWLPPRVRGASRRIAIDPADGDGAEPALPPDLADLARWLARAVTAEGASLAQAREAWRAVAALAAVEERSIESMFAELGALDRASASAPTLREYLQSRGLALGARFHVAADGPAQWARALHAWGRGRAGARVDDVAILLARRAVADRLAGADAHAWRATVRWSSLLPMARADELERATTARFPWLDEVRHG